MNKDQSPANFLGIDYGRKHCGLALSLDRSMPLGFLTVEGSLPEKVTQIVKLILANQIDAVVVGLPFSAVHGDQQVKENRLFVSELQKHLPALAIHEADETLTTKLAERYATKEKSHQEAARIILEDWLKKENFLA